MKMKVAEIAGKKYKVSTSGTFYNYSTSDEMVALLEKIRTDETRCIFYYGDTETGKAWGAFGEIGRIGRSNGQAKVPILIYNKRSVGGFAISTHCIVKIETTKWKRTLYQHANYHN